MAIREASGGRALLRAVFVYDERFAAIEAPASALDMRDAVQSGPPS